MNLHRMMTDRLNEKQWIRLEESVNEDTRETISVFVKYAGSGNMNTNQEYMRVLSDNNYNLLKKNIKQYNIIPDVGVFYRLNNRLYMSRFDESIEVCEPKTNNIDNYCNSSSFRQYQQLCIDIINRKPIENVGSYLSDNERFISALKLNLYDINIYFHIIFLELLGFEYETMQDNDKIIKIINEYNTWLNKMKINAISHENELYLKTIIFILNNNYAILNNNYCLTKENDKKLGHDGQNNKIIESKKDVIKSETFTLQFQDLTDKLINNIVSKNEIILSHKKKEEVLDINDILKQLNMYCNHKVLELRGFVLIYLMTHMMENNNKSMTIFPKTVQLELAVGVERFINMCEKYNDGAELSDSSLNIRSVSKQFIYDLKYKYHQFLIMYPFSGKEIMNKQSARLMAYTVYDAFNPSYAKKVRKNQENIIVNMMKHLKTGFVLGDYAGLGCGKTSVVLLIGLVVQLLRQGVRPKYNPTHIQDDENVCDENNDEDYIYLNENEYMTRKELRQIKSIVLNQTDKKQAIVEPEKQEDKKDQKQLDNINLSNMCVLYVCKNPAVRDDVVKLLINAKITVGIATFDDKKDEVKVVNNYKTKTTDQNRIVVVAEPLAATRLLEQNNVCNNTEQKRQYLVMLDEPTADTDTWESYGLVSNMKLIKNLSPWTVLSSATLPKFDAMKYFVDDHKKKYPSCVFKECIYNEIQIGCHAYIFDGKTDTRVFVPHMGCTSKAQFEYVVNKIKNAAFLARLYTYNIVNFMWNAMKACMVTKIPNIDYIFKKIKNINANTVKKIGLHMLDIVLLHDEETIIKFCNYMEGINTDVVNFKLENLGTTDAHKFTTMRMIADPNPYEYAKKCFGSLINDISSSGYNYIKSCEDYDDRFKTHNNKIISEAKKHGIHAVYDESLGHVRISMDTSASDASLKKNKISGGDGGDKNKAYEDARERLNDSKESKLNVINSMIDSIVEFKFPDFAKINSEKHYNKYAPHIVENNKKINYSIYKYSNDELYKRLKNCDIFLAQLLHCGVGVFSPNKINNQDYLNLVLELASDGNLAYLVCDASISYGTNYPFGGGFISKAFAEQHSYMTLNQLNGRFGRVGKSWYAEVYFEEGCADILKMYIRGLTKENGKSDLKENIEIDNMERQYNEFLKEDVRRNDEIVTECLDELDEIMKEFEEAESMNNILEEIMSEDVPTAPLDKVQSRFMTPSASTHSMDDSVSDTSSVATTDSRFDNMTNAKKTPKPIFKFGGQKKSEYSPPERSSNNREAFGQNIQRPQNTVPIVDKDLPGVNFRRPVDNSAKPKLAFGCKPANNNNNNRNTKPDGDGFVKVPLRKK